MFKIILLCFLVILILSCTAGSNEFTTQKGNDAGFFKGFWHGLISIVTLIISLFTDKISIYEVHNAGFLYDLGFLLGAGTLTGGTLWRRRKRR
ncbi:MAG: hypothetical protein RAO94_04500 [Candidatus Stygibacter australis]|nr:hypothetical protein [Candidatus Stygibacter australis]MDP8321596.1 hypothetical protein [Candidatus Stygibacter australis]